MHIESKHEPSDQHDNVRITIAFDPHELSLTPTPFGLMVTLRDATTVGEIGSPALPRRTIKVAVPHMQWPTGLTIENAEWMTVTDKPEFVAPMQPLRAGESSGTSRSTQKRACPCGDCCECNTRPAGPSEFPTPFPAPDVVAPVPALYETAIRSPQPIAVARGIEQIGLSNIARIELAPVRYREDGRLELCTRCDLVITTSDSAPFDDKQEAIQLLQERLGREIDPTRVVPMPGPVISSATHATRLAAIARSEVINGALIRDYATHWPRYELASEYLIITDDHTWDEATISPVRDIPGMVAAFTRLADWKRARGISARVVTITDIVNGRYGNFRAGARDLQEVIRRFLKSAVPRWGVSWLLLGGDVSVVPVRKVAGAVEGGIGVATVEPPADNTSFWTGSFLKMHALAPGVWFGNNNSMNVLVNPATGTRIPFDATGASSSASPGWYFTTSDTYSSRSTMATNFVRVNGPASLVNASLQWLYAWNTLPTDFYYASLESFVIAERRIEFLFGLSFSIPYVYFPEHDWDALNNGIYGQHNGSGDLDGVVMSTSVSVGRAPVESELEASTFVSKVIAYESFRDPVSAGWLDSNWPRRLLLASSDWGGPTYISSTNASPPGDNQYHHAAGALRSLIKLTAPPGSFQYEVIAEFSDTDRRVIPYDQNVTDGGRGWHFARSATDLRANGLLIPFLFFGTLFFPLPSEWIVVYGPVAEVAPRNYLMDWSLQDGSMADQEQLREQLRAEIPGWDTVSRLYEDQLDLTPAQAGAAPTRYLTQDRLKEALNAAPHIVSLSGHGNSEGCCGGSTWLAEGLTNGYHTFIGYADSCLTNQLDAQDAFSEALLVARHGGAVAYVGNTRFSWIGVGDDYQRAFFHRLTSVRQLGLLNDSRLGLLGATGYNTVYDRWAIFSLNLMGDPEMQVYRGRQVRRFRSAVKDGIRRDRITIHVDEVPPPVPVPHPAPPVEVLVHVRQGDRVLTAYANPAGDADFDLSHFALGAIEITLSHDEFATHQETFELRGPDWVTGTVTELSHREGGPQTSCVRLNVDGVERRFTASGERPDYRLILDAIENAYVGRVHIALLVESLADGGVIERFRFRDDVAAST